MRLTGIQKTGLEPNMTIVRDTEHTENYVVLKNGVLEDNRLSWEARGVLAYLISRPANWSPSMTQICQEGGIGRSKGKRIFAELREAGYLKKSQARTSRGQYGIAELICYETPRADESENKVRQHSNVVEMGVRKTALPVHRPTVIQPTVDSPLTSTVVTSTEKETNTVEPLVIKSDDRQIDQAPTNPTKPKSKAVNQEEADALFAAFWALWPKRVAKAPARAAWNKLKGQPATLALIKLDLEARANSGTWDDPQYIPNPATYLNQQRWEDEYHGTHQQAPTTARSGKYRSLEDTLNNVNW